MNTVKDAYLSYVDWIAAHPHIAGWLIVALAVAALIF